MISVSLTSLPFPNHYCIVECDDRDWPEPDRNGKQELEIVLGDKHITFCTSKFGSLMDIEKSMGESGKGKKEDMIQFYYLLQDIKGFVFSLLNLRFRIKPF